MHIVEQLRCSSLTLDYKYSLVEGVLNSVHLTLQQDLIFDWVCKTMLKMGIQQECAFRIPILQERFWSLLDTLIKSSQTQGHSPFAHKTQTFHLFKNLCIQLQNHEINSESLFQSAVSVFQAMEPYFRHSKSIQPNAWIQTAQQFAEAASKVKLLSFNTLFDSFFASLTLCLAANKAVEQACSLLDSLSNYIERPVISNFFSAVLFSDENLSALILHCEAIIKDPKVSVVFQTQNSKRRKLDVSDRPKTSFPVLFLELRSISNETKNLQNLMVTLFTILMDKIQEKSPMLSTYAHFLLYREFCALISCSNPIQQEIATLLFEKISLILRLADDCSFSIMSNYLSTFSDTRNSNLPLKYQLIRLKSVSAINVQITKDHVSRVLCSALNSDCQIEQFLLDLFEHFGRSRQFFQLLEIIFASLMIHSCTQQNEFFVFESVLLIKKFMECVSSCPNETKISIAELILTFFSKFENIRTKLSVGLLLNGAISCLPKTEFFSKNRIQIFTNLVDTLSKTKTEYASICLTTHNNAFKHKEYREIVAESKEMISLFAQHAPWNALTALHQLKLPINDCLKYQKIKKDAFWSGLPWDQSDDSKLVVWWMQVVDKLDAIDSEKIQKRIGKMFISSLCFENSTMFSVGMVSKNIFKSSKFFEIEWIQNLVISFYLDHKISVETRISKIWPLILMTPINYFTESEKICEFVAKTLIEYAETKTVEESVAESVMTILSNLEFDSTVPSETLDIIKSNIDSKQKVSVFKFLCVHLASESPKTRERCLNSALSIQNEEIRSLVLLYLCDCISKDMFNLKQNSNEILKESDEFMQQVLQVLSTETKFDFEFFSSFLKTGLTRPKNILILKAFEKLLLQSDCVVRCLEFVLEQRDVDYVVWMSFLQCFVGRNSTIAFKKNFRHVFKSLLEIVVGFKSPMEIVQLLKLLKAICDALHGLSSRHICMIYLLVTRIFYFQITLSAVEAKSIVMGILYLLWTIQANSRKAVINAPSMFVILLKDILRLFSEDTNMEENELLKHAPYDVECAKLWTRILSSITQLSSASLDAYQRAFSSGTYLSTDKMIKPLRRHLVHILGEYVALQSHVRASENTNELFLSRSIQNEEIKERIVPGLYAILDICTEQDTSFLLIGMHPASSECLKKLVSDYKKHHKFNAKE